MGNRSHYRQFTDPLPKVKREGRPLRRGVSLVELLAVMAILAIIAVAAVTHMRNYATDAHQNSCYVNQGDIEVQAQLYFRNQGAWPPANLNGFGTSTKYFPDGHLPVCPKGGTYSFNSLTGEVSCSQHP